MDLYQPLAPTTNPIEADRSASDAVRELVTAATSGTRKEDVYELRVANKVVHLDNPPTQKSTKDTPARRTPGRISARQRRASRLFDVPVEKQRYDLFVPLHELWTQYSSQLIAGDTNELAIQTKVSKADWHGAIVSVVRSRCPSYVGLTGILVRETENMLCLITRTNAIKEVPKRHSVFEMVVGKYKVTLYGNQIVCRSSARTSRKFKAKPTVDL